MIHSHSKFRRIGRQLAVEIPSVNVIPRRIESLCGDFAGVKRDEFGLGRRRRRRIRQGEIAANRDGADRDCGRSWPVNRKRRRWRRRRRIGTRRKRGGSGRW